VKAALKPDSAEPVEAPSPAQMGLTAPTQAQGAAGTPLGPDRRLDLAVAWLNTQAPNLQQKGWVIQTATMRPASSDASFRRYFRLDATEEGRASSLILMDAPPPHEATGPFLHAADIFHRAQLSTPRAIAADETNGFLLLTDLGNTTFLQQIMQVSNPDQREQVAGDLYRDAWRALIRLQAMDTDAGLAPYDHARLMQEMQLFESWFIDRHLQVALTAEERQQLQAMLELICNACLAQPQVIVHRDYHSRNLMVLAQHNPGILDFQDAVIGPITYDLVSLLRDAYVNWPEELQLDWAIRYWQDARTAGLPITEDFSDFWRDFEWMGLQRQLKVLGIFARLYHRDHKDDYLKDLPRVWDYAAAVAMRYVPLAPLARLMRKLEPAFQRTCQHTSV
jgi:N-acetylmuramate 1-kinase